MLVLGIESSCDETAAALVEFRHGKISVISDVVASQIAIHRKFGGVVPEVAARTHMEHILPVIERALGGRRRPDVIAVTAGPGLITSLLVGAQTAQTLSYLWGKPLVAVNHIEGHVYANWIASSFKLQALRIFPALVLIVSGGHTELVLMKGHGRYRLLGATRDDAAGEAFDKGAKLLSLGYPGGPAIAKTAERGDPSAFPFPRPMLSEPGYEFSFSGLKTALLYAMMNRKKSGAKITGKIISDLSASYQAAIVDVLAAKTLRAADEHRVKAVLCGGGVMANTELRSALQKKLSQKRIPLHIPSIALCTDNAVMIAAAGAFKAARKEYTDWRKIEVRSRWEMAQIVKRET
ncbi:tRNA (adenosine(37)-N6)-threonylcarbamoyltransferase complex transferase subunit TsaD [Candidatus Uhrbacteria bacterium]|nr:tRNA (adenosine(37)-N6)-threonylcarbamoyltransferase complex transferase subunit TsaD [Candidatus Uhrbacteria bacterium]